MKIFTSGQVREIDSYTIEHEPTESIDLMERAADRLNSWYVRHFQINRRVVIFAGPGNNGGDALALARKLSERQYRVLSLPVDLGGGLSGNCRINLDRLKEQGISEIRTIASVRDIPEINQTNVIVDGIFGSGLTRTVTGAAAEMIRFINGSGATVVSIDIPSGLFGEDNRTNDYTSIVRADYTLTFQFPFRSFFFKENAPFVGCWTVLDIRLHPVKVGLTQTDYRTLEREDVRGILSEREIFSHKGTYGHALLICGSYGMMGAAVLSARACLRGGAGLVTLHVPKSGVDIVQTAVPEAIVSPDSSETVFTGDPGTDNFQSVGIGPGIGQGEKTCQALYALLSSVKVPLVIDADAINILAEHREWIGQVPPGSILTPHPKEFDRLAGDSGTGYERHLKQIAFSARHGVIVILKGAYTGISEPGGGYFFNTTGNPGMATGGSGDVLTGLIASLLAQGVSATDAALLAVYVHGLAGDLASESRGEEAMIAGDIVEMLGAAFMQVKRKPMGESSRK